MHTRTQSMLIKRCFSSADCVEGFQSFLDKRAPVFPMTVADLPLAELDQATKWRARLPSRSKL